MGNIKASVFITTLVVLLAISAVGNAFLYRRVNHLEKENAQVDRRLMVFANVTATIVQEGNVFRRDVLRSGMVGYPPYKAEKDYLIDFDEHLEGGILFKFDAQNKLIGWQEYPPSERRKHRN